MSGNSDLILAGIAGGDGTAGGLAWFAPVGTAAPTDGDTPLAVAWKTPGLVSTAGLVEAISENTNTINAFGLSVAARKVVTSTDQTFALTMLESNPISLAIYHRKALNAITPDATGAFDFTTGQYNTIRYAAVFDLKDGTNVRRVYCPDVEVTGRENISTTPGEAVAYGVTLTAYAGSDGVATHQWYIMDALATG